MSEPSPEYQQSLKNAEDLVRIYRSEKKRREVLRAILNGTQDGILSCDADFRIGVINDSLCRVLDLKKDQAVGQKVAEVIVSTGLGDGLSRIGIAPTANASFEVEVLKPVKRSFLVSASPLTARAEDGKGWILIFHDQTSRKHAESLRNEFLRLTSDELLSPLKDILKISKLLKSADANQRADWVTSLEKCAQRMTRSVTEFTVVVLGDEARTKDQFKKVDLGRVLKDVEFNLAPIAAYKEVALSFLGPTSPLFVLGDHTMLVKMFSYVVENAVLFNNKQGMVEILLKDDPSPLVEIIDTGIGIPQTDLEAVFEPFFQVEAQRADSAKGSGMGLHLARKMVHRHGGSIKLKSILKKGTTISVGLKSFDKSAASVAALSLGEAQSQSERYAEDLARAYVAGKNSQAKLELTEKQLALSQRLSGLGAMAAGVSHDIANMVVPLLGFAEVALLRPGPKDPEVRQDLERIVCAGNKMSVALERIRNFVKQTPGKRTKTTVAVLVDTAVELASNDIKLKGINLKVSHGPQKKITVETGAIENVFTNLILNACHAMPRGGTLEITTEIGRDTVEVNIRDTGCGMSPEVLDKVFDPFFTTRGDKGGTGLGLFSSFKTVESHAGTIGVESTVGEGTTFKILLPYER